MGPLIPHWQRPVLVLIGNGRDAAGQQDGSTPDGQTYTGISLQSPL